jgi:rhodanese-related sulfurtransferase
MSTLQTPNQNPNPDGTRPASLPIDVDPLALEGWLAAGDCVLVDVREPFEHAAERIEHAVSIPLSTLDAESVDARFPGKRLVFHCAGGKRSAKACERYSERSGERAYHLAGGIEAWKQAHRPTLKPAKAGLPIMRQVQMIAGLLVVLGVVLGLGVSERFLALSVFVGVGLMFAGATGWCGMAKLLSKMPWNASGQPSACTVNP